jgi:type II secretory pathway pseudopilin PulG
MGGRNRFSTFEIVVLLMMFCVVGLVDAPDMIKAGEEVKLSELVECLELMRSRLDVYRAEHQWSLPPHDSFESFEVAMTSRKNQKGPYLDEIPANTFNGLNRVRFDGASAGSGLAGWRLDTKTGMFQADHDPSFAEL